MKKLSPVELFRRRRAAEADRLRAEDNWPTPFLRRPNTILVDVPTRFFHEHQRLEIPHGRVIKELSRTMRVEVTKDELTEWYSAADYYSTCGGPGWSDNGMPSALAVGSSARATCRMIKNLGEAAF